jgi:hypothetical protein
MQVQACTDEASRSHKAGEIKMSAFNCYVETAHRNIRLYQIIAATGEAAKREAEEYGKVKYVQRTGPAVTHTGVK